MRAEGAMWAPRLLLCSMASFHPRGSDERHLPPVPLISALLRVMKEAGSLLEAQGGEKAGRGAARVDLSSSIFCCWCLVT